jgi:hypothetical protein
MVCRMPHYSWQKSQPSDRAKDLEFRALECAVNEESEFANVARVGDGRSRYA